MIDTQKPQARKPFISLGTRITVPVVLLVALVATGTYLGLMRSSRTSAMRFKEEAADMVVKLTSLSVVPAVVFGDEIEMKRAVSDLANNPQVTDVELWSFDVDSQGQPPLASFHRSGTQPLERPHSTRSTRTHEPGSITATEPVKGPDGKIVAMLSARFSTARETAALAALSRQVLGVALITALLLAGAILWVLRSLVISPIRKLQHATRSLASGQAGGLEIKGAAARVDDEVVQLSASFRDMAGAVRDREMRLGVRNAELRLILDSVDQGFLTVRLDGSFQEERSAIVETWLGVLPEPAYLWDLFQLIERSMADWTRMAWEQVREGVLPWEVALDQLPQRSVRGSQHFDFKYHPIVNGDEIDGVVMVVTDVTAEVERQRALAEQHEFSVLVDQCMRDRRWFHEFWREAATLVARIVTAEPISSESLRRDLHTLKGNARYFSLTRLSEICHSLEDYLAEHSATRLDETGRAQLRDAWAALEQRMQPLLNNAQAFVELSQEDYQRLLDGLSVHRPHELLLDLVRGLRDESTQSRLQRARDAIVQVCQKLGKAQPTVTLEHNHVRVSPERFAPFWAIFPHVLANAADHGLESDAERLAAHKSLPAHVRLATRSVGGELWVEVEDDGRGIDWSRVSEKATALGLPQATEQELVQALLSDGFSLRAQVSEVSGRGIGLAAVRTVVSSLDGSVELESKHGQGTCWRFRLPLLGSAKPLESRLPARAAS